MADSLQYHNGVIISILRLMKGGKRRVAINEYIYYTLFSIKLGRYELGYDSAQITCDRGAAILICVQICAYKKRGRRFWTCIIDFGGLAWCERVG